jgi:hypothetical protein
MNFGSIGRVQFMNTSKNMIQRLRKLETERKNLLMEIEELKKMADSKARALESEVDMLREEVKSLRELLGTDDIEIDLNQKKPKQK